MMTIITMTTTSWIMWMFLSGNQDLFGKYGCPVVAWPVRSCSAQSSCSLSVRFSPKWTKVIIERSHEQTVCWCWQPLNLKPCNSSSASASPLSSWFGLFLTSLPIQPTSLLTRSGLWLLSTLSFKWKHVFVVSFNDFLKRTPEKMPLYIGLFAWCFCAPVQPLCVV